MSDLRERHGIVKREGTYNQSVTTDECANCIRLAANDGQSERAVYLSPNEARHIAAKLRQIARRIDKKLGA